MIYVACSYTRGKTLRLVPLFGMNDYLCTLSPFTHEDLILPEVHLLRVLRELDRMGRLGEQTVRVYEGDAGARTYVGKVDASSVLDAGGVSETLIET